MHVCQTTVALALLGAAGEIRSDDESDPTQPIRVILIASDYQFVKYTRCLLDLEGIGNYESRTQPDRERCESPLHQVMGSRECFGAPFILFHGRCFRQIDDVAKMFSMLTSHI